MQCIYQEPQPCSDSLSCSHIGNLTPGKPCQDTSHSVCVCVREGGVGPCMPLWRPEVDTGCFCVLLSPCCLGTGSRVAQWHWTSSVGWLAGQACPWSLLFPALVQQVGWWWWWGVTGACPAFHVGSGNRTYIPRCVQQVLYTRSHLHSPQQCLKYDRNKMPSRAAMTKEMLPTFRTLSAA